MTPKTSPAQNMETVRQSSAAPATPLAPYPRNEGEQQAFRAIFVAGHSTEQIVDFDKWAPLGGVIAGQVVSAFEEIAARFTPKARLRKRGKLTKFREFISNFDEPALPSLDCFTSDMVTRFIAKISHGSRGLRNSYYFMMRLTVEHACRSASKRPPKFPRSPWSTLKPKKIEKLPEPSPSTCTTVPLISTSKKRRTYLTSCPVPTIEVKKSENIFSIDVEPTLIRNTQELKVFFPKKAAEPAQFVNLSNWLEFGERSALQVASAYKDLFRTSGSRTRTTGHRRLTKLFKFLAGLRDARPETIVEITAAQLLDYKRVLDTLSSVPTRAKYWKLAIQIIEHACEAEGHETPRHPGNPWPGCYAHCGSRSEVLTLETTGAVLRACMSDMREVMEQADDPEYEGPLLQDLLGFIVPLTFWTMFNPETITALRMSDVRAETHGRIALVGSKGRSTRDQVASFSATDTHICAPARIVANVERITARLRASLPPDQREYLFVGRLQNLWRSEVHAKPFHFVESAGHSYRQAFAKKHGIQPFNFRSIRATGAVIVNRLFADDVKTAQALMNHLRIETTDGYVRQEAKRSEEMRLADHMEKRMRFVRSNGARDVRDLPLAPQSAATPGFVCADPFAPPSTLGQEPGLCAAYAACPTCPLASVDRLCPTSLAFVLRLRNQIRNARDEPDTNVHRWLRIWKPRMDALTETWLPMFAASAHAVAAERIADVSLVPLPRIGEL